MATVIRKSLRDFAAIIVLLVIGLAVTWYIVQNQRLRVPVLEERPFELNAEFETAQAVVPGQGQTIRVAGVRVGDVAKTEYEDGLAKVTFAVDRKYLPIYRDATLLLRPTTGLKDMFFQLDPGTRAAGEVDEGGTIPVANTAPDVNLDEILELLDTDTRDYLRALIVGAGQGLEGEGERLGKLLGSIGPVNRDLRRINSKVAERRAELRTLVHNFRLVTEEAAKADRDIVRLVEQGNTALAAAAQEDPDIQRAIALLPGTLQAARLALENTNVFAGELAPTLEELRPFVRRLDAMNQSLESLATVATPAIRDQLRPFTRVAKNPVADLGVASKRLAKATPALDTVVTKVNRLGNMASYNPNGAEAPGTEGRDEGYLYWAGWLSHNSNQIFTAGDANSTYRRIYFTIGCDQDLAYGWSLFLHQVVSGVSTAGRRVRPARTARRDR